MLRDWIRAAVHSLTLCISDRTNVSEERRKVNIAMGISISLLMASDDQIRDFIAQPNLLEDLLNHTIPNATEDYCCLANLWHGLHYLLTGEVRGGELPMCALRRGEVRFSGVSDPTHAIYSNTAQAFATELSKLSEAILKERFDPRKVPNAGRDGRTVVHDPPLFPALSDLYFRELMTYFSGLRDFCLRTANRDMGLLFCRYEDW